jgi:hypothetical protein
LNPVQLLGRRPVATSGQLPQCSDALTMHQQATASTL